MLSCLKLNRIVALLLAAGPAIVAAAQPDAGQLFNEQQQMQRDRLDQFPQEESKGIKRPVPKEIKGVHIRLTAIRFSGDVGVVGEEALQSLLHDAIGKEFDFSGLRALADRVGDYIRSKGYVLAHAYLPKQYLKGGVIEIAVLAGRLQAGADAIVVQGRLRISPQRLKWLAEDSITPGNVVRQKDLERAALLINDVPGIAAYSNIERGTDPGTVRLVVDADEAPLINGQVGVDNFGDHYTGTWRATGRLDVNDPLRIGDQASLSAIKAADIELGQMNYDWPINYRGLRASVSYAKMRYSIGKELKSLDASGSSDIIGGGINYPIRRARIFNLWGSVNYASKNFKDQAFGEVLRNKHVNAWSFALSGNSYDHIGGGGLTNFSLAVTAGDLDLSKVANDLSLDQNSGALTNGSYDKVNYNLTRLQRIDRRFSLFGAINGQFASKNLDSSEKFFLGGPTAVRAYPIGEAAGDQGWVANIELRYDLPVTSAWGELQWVGFVDTGGILLHKNPWSGSLGTLTGDNNYTLSGVGMGLNLTKGKHYALHSAWAARVGSNHGRSIDNLDSDGKRSSSRFWLYGIYWL